MSETQAADPKPPATVMPSEVKANPATYQGKTFKVRARPNAPTAKDPATHYWPSRCDGMDVEFSDSAKTFYDEARRTRALLVWDAELIQRNGSPVLRLKAGKAY